MPYVGFVKEEGLKNPDIIDYFKVLGRKKGKNFTTVKVAIESSKIRNAVRVLQSNLRKNFFFYVYKDEKFIVVFPDRQFWMIEKNDLRKAKNYGVSKGIPEEQMKFEV